MPYRIVGSMASMAYGEPRFTNDVDVFHKWASELGVVEELQLVRRQAAEREK
ncbi:MAG: hypothetical protein H8E44_19460 [Planctomycetes bacterium]|nr:hypothetical protein [Planctomycetota bacterium]MBL7037018.1 hypothetical protein [Pirellulaceae bacterium]